MKIAIDMQTTLGKKTGFGFYVSSLVNELKKLDGHNYYLIKPESDTDFSAPQRWWWDQVVFPKKAIKRSVDIIHQPCFSAPILSRKAKVVVTAHDLIAVLHGEDIPFFSRLFFKRWMPFSYRFADKIIAVSEHTKKDIIEILKIPESKITVIHEAADESFKPIKDLGLIAEAKEKYQIQEKYLLYIGTINPRKNLSFLIDVYKEILKTNPDYQLVIAGKKGWHYNDLFEKIKSYSIEEKVVFTGYLDEKDKPSIYSGAEAFLFPSLYEGFGLPPLEAMACGTPVIASNTSSLPEVCGQAAILLEPDNKEGWVKSINQLINSESMRKKLSQLGIDQAKKFSWRETAKQTLKIYEEFNK